MPALTPLDKSKYSNTQASQASTLCTTHWRAGTTLPGSGLPPDLIPPDIASAYRAQSFVRKTSAYPLWGWKIAATSIHGQNHINVDRPLAGRILRERVTAYGEERVELRGDRMLVAELEFVFRVGETLGAKNGEGKWSREEFMAVVDGIFSRV